MPLTKVQVISNALALLGKKPIMNLVNQSDIVTTAEQAFDFLLPGVLGTGFWRFAVRIQQLPQLVQTPVGGYWGYAYQLPGDYLKMVHLYPRTYDYEIYEGGKLYSNFNSQYQPLYIEYIFQPDIVTFPDYFWNYFVYEIATYLALSSAQSANYFQVLDPKRSIQMGIALAADAQNRPQTPLQSAPMISNRFVSTFASG